ncbi:MAG TPA: hypothetical protein VGB43_02325, partial [Flavobacterium sp.]
MRSSIILLIYVFSIHGFCQQIPQFSFCDTDGDGNESIDIALLNNVILSQNPDLFDISSSLYLTCGNGDIDKIENLSSNPTVTTICQAIAGTGDIAVNSVEEIFVVGATVDKIENCTPVSSYPAEGIVLSFDPADNLYACSGGTVQRATSSDYNNFSTWHDFPGSPSGDCVIFNGKMYFAWLIFAPDNFIRLYEVTLDDNFNYVSHVDLGGLPDGVMGLATSGNELYASSGTTLYKVHLADFTFETILINSNPDPAAIWTGAASVPDLNLSVNAYISESDAVANNNPLPANWINTVAGGQVIYVSIYEPLSGQYQIFPVQLIINSVMAHQPLNLVECDADSTGLQTFDLSAQSAEVLGSQSSSDYFITYHLTQSDADLGINPLPLAFQNTANPQSIFVRLSNITDNTCYSTTSFQVSVFDSPILESPLDEVICAGHGTTLMAPSGFASYHWSTGEISQSISVTTAGVYSVEVINDAGCQAMKSVTVANGNCNIQLGISPNH